MYYSAANIKVQTKKHWKCTTVQPTLRFKPKNTENVLQCSQHSGSNQKTLKMYYSAANCQAWSKRRINWTAYKLKNWFFLDKSRMKAKQSVEYCEIWWHKCLSFVSVTLTVQEIFLNKPIQSKQHTFVLFGVKELYYNFTAE